MDYTNQYGALRQVGELDDNRQRLLAAKAELDDATKRYQDAKQAYDQAYTALRFFEPDVKERQQAFAKSIKMAVKRGENTGIPSTKGIL